MFIRAETYKELKEQVSVACVKAAALDGENAHLRGKLERATAMHNFQQEQIVVRSRELDEARQETDVWRKRAGHLEEIAIALSRALAEKCDEADDLEELLDDVDAALEVVVTGCEECQQKSQKKGKKNG